jgi:hypothetical protein
MPDAMPHHDRTKQLDAVLGYFRDVVSWDSES